MEDGDDDTSLTADGQKWKEDQGSSENDILVPKDEYEEVCSDEKHVVSSTSQSDDYPFVASSQLHDKEDTSDPESENKACNSDPNLLDNTSEFVDSCDELHNVAREPSPASVGGEQLAASEENNGILLQEESSEPFEDQNEQLVSREEENVLSSMGEAENVHSAVGEEGNPLSSMEESENVHSSLGEERNAFSSMEETENVHSSMGEEEEGVEEEEEEEEEEQELQTSVSSDELISKLPEENSLLSDENFKKSDHSNEEYDQCITEENEAIEEKLGEPLNNFDPASDLDVCSDLQPEEREVERSFEEDRGLSKKVNKSDHENEDFEENCNVESESEKLFKEECAQSVDFHEECISPDEKDSVMEDSVSDTTDHIEKCDEIASKDDEIASKEDEIASKEEEIASKEDEIASKEDEIASKEDEKHTVDLVESCNQLEINAKQILMDDTEDVSSPIHIVEDEQLEQDDKNEITQSFDNCEPRAEESMLRNSARSVESDSDTAKLTDYENVDKMTEQEDVLSSIQEREEAISSPVSEGRDVSYGNGVLLVQIPIEREKPKQSVELKDDEMDIEEITEQDSEMHEIDTSVKSPELENTAYEKAPSPISHFQEPSLITSETSDENIVNESINESKSVEKADDVDMSVKVNGEVEITKNNLLNDKESSAHVKEKVSLKRKLHCSPSQGILCDVSPPESVKGNVHFKGFKKRYIAQASDISSKETPDVPTSVQEELRVKNKRSAKKLILETPQVLVSHQQLPDGTQANTPLTEYAQYLGLQPTVKFKCYNCGESGFPSMLKLQEHQNICLKNVRIHTYSKPPPSPIVEPAPSTNFRITRKVYLCSACGTYYENWNLFLHMREVHKRHICLFCLLMFSQADKLAQHLSGKHGIADSSYSSPEQFLNEFKGSFFVMCCTCEQMFSERDDFFDHLCKDTSVINTDQACTLCGLKGAHFPTCRRAFTDSNSLSAPAQSNQQSAVVSSNTDSSQNSQSSSQEKLGTTSKYSLQNDKPTSGRKSQYKLSDQNVERTDKNHNTGDVDDDYDISDAASYCHVNIHEPEKQKQESSEEKVATKDAVIDDINMDVERINHEVQSNEENRNKNSDNDGTLGNESANNLENNTVSKEDFVSINESQLNVEKPLSHSAETAQEEDEEEGEEEDTREMEVDDKPESQPPLSPNTDDAKQIETCRETQVINQSKSPNDGDTESDTSASGADSHDSDGSSSSSEASSDENEQEEKEPLKEDVKSEDSDLEKSDSDKMSIVVDEARSEDDLDKQDNVNDDLNNSNITESETNEINEHKNDSPVNSDFKVIDKSTNNIDFGEEQQDNIQIAGDDVPLLELTLEETLDALPIQTVVKECVKISCSTCVYCNHAKKIAVNGKQLVLHLLAEHRFEPVVCSDSGELTPIFGFVDNLKAKLSELQDMYFNTDSYDSADKNFTRPYDRTYECFHCHFITTLHKELYVHNRKMHQKTILLCIMCKSNFYSYSELLCHLCPGIYVPDSNILFRCCLCVVDGLPSAFRLMVHLRKRHHACDVCLETTGDQQKLSNHVWKHKLHHLCYRCGIAYRNKPDITKHLFWKHGTESVLCKKCLQKKWPHVYHFCIPPTAFLCEECNASFSRAVALKVHKRLHAGDISYQCDECEEKFISKKLLRRHKEKHRQVVVEKEDYKSNENIADDEMQEAEEDEVKSQTPIVENDDIDKDMKEGGSDCAAEKTNSMPDNGKDTETPQEICREPEEVELSKPDEVKDHKKSKVVDVYDLPPLNLSSESDDSDEEQVTKQPLKDVEPDDSPKMAVPESAVEIKSHEGEQPTEEEVQPVQIVDGVWDNFKTYKANLEKREILQAQASESLKVSSSTSVADSAENHAIVDIVMADHDYCVLPEKPNEDSQITEDIIQILPSQNTDVPEKETAENLDDKTSGFGADHNYCFNTSPHPEDKNDPPSSLPQIPSNLTVQSPPLALPHPSLPLSPAQPPPPPPTPPPNPSVSSPKKKQKSPKKKQKQSGSSSSSDSSSNSDSSSCTCGTNCSCTSNSSSSSSGSSSTSSDSDSSSSEGRRRQAARRERRRERAKRKLETGSKGGTPPPAAGLSTPGVETGGGSGGRPVEVTPTPLQIDSSGAGSLQVDDTPVMTAPEPEDNDFLIRESDLDTTETETDEDFYDKYPQKQANKLLAEKRNQLLLLAAVAPVNNGTIAQPSPPPATETQEPTQKKKVKTKRHKKAQHNSSEKKESKLKLNIPAAYYNSPSFSVGNVRHSVSPLPNSHSTSHVSRLPLDTYSPANPEASSTPTAYHSTGSGSENESKRLSKRKRIPKKFYGDSSDEEAEHAPQQPFKWRKVTPASNSNPVVQPTVPSGFTYRAVSVPPPEPPVHVQSFPPPEKSDEEDGDESDSGHEAKRSSSESSNSDSDNEQTDADSDVETVPTVTNVVSAVSGSTTQQKNENLYCYCQCPYDEVSEMIACDGKDCSIEWFHFECVGIMVPPKGKWFCPDCRKKTAAKSEYLLHA